MVFTFTMREMKAEGPDYCRASNFVLGNGADERGVLHLPLTDHRGNIAVAAGGWRECRRHFAAQQPRMTSLPGLHRREDGRGGGCWG